MAIHTLYDSIKSLFSGRSFSSAVSALDSLIAITSEVKASDLHLDPTESYVAVRIRIDGYLHALDPLPKEMHEELIARIKVLAGLRTDEHFVPQDGRFSVVRNNGERSDIRLSVAPTYFGENAVLRFLTPTRHSHLISDLGFSPTQQDRLLKAISRSQGMILVSGPTGSGKTTTLYTLLQHKVEEPISVVTIEDPIEYSIEGVVQIQARTGCAFADGLRSILRQDPDVIMVGEIRDADTAGFATDAALTGHLVFSTVHANNAPGVLLIEGSGEYCLTR